MNRGDEPIIKDRRMLSNNKIKDYTIASGDNDEIKYLVPEFDNEAMDLDEDELSEDELNACGIDDNECYRMQRHDNYTVSGTNSWGKKVDMLIFSVDAVLHRGGPIKAIAEKHNISFKIQKTECKLVRTILSSHGLHECSAANNDYNLMWTGCHVRPFTLRTMSEFQKINHFPRSYELTRKDRLFKNVQRMQQIKGLKNFDFLPPSYLIPSEFQDLCHNFSKDKGPYIVKPVALSRGRGIFLCNHPNQIPLDEQLIVSKYISNPYLIDGLKFDIRMYVLVTSYDPLVVYLYEEGLTRFATVKYQNAPKNLRMQCMHLTNYSVNKKNDGFIQNDDADVEDFGNKWSLGALLRYLKSKDIDTTCLMMKIEDIIIKSLISVESQIAASCRMFLPYRGNCYELYGYDIIIDEHLRPWLLEVNLSPSLSCDSPLDFKIKSHMLADMFNVIGVACQDPVVRNNTPSYNSNNRISKSAVSRSSSSPNHRVSYTPNSTIRRPTAGLRRKDVPSNSSPLRSEENRLVRRIKEEHKRCGGWIRIFPTAESINTYFPFFHNSISDQTNMNAYTSSQINLNLFVHSKLYPERQTDPSNPNIRPSTQSANNRSRLALHSVNYNAAIHKISLSQIVPSGQSYYDKICSNYTDTQMRVPFYERKLGEELTSKERITRSVSKNKIYQTESKQFVSDSEEDMTSSESRTSEEGVNNSDLDADLDEEESHSSKDTITLTKIIDSGGKLTKIQARLAFSAYLARVQYRLLIESRSENSDLTSDEENSRHEQMELVLRFLKRAAANMSVDEFSVSAVPDRTLALKTRQEWLAKILGEFIRIYSRETKLAESKQGNEVSFEIDQKLFYNFLRVASENDLEQTLSNYTKINKSAGIFLNPNLPAKVKPQLSESISNYPPLGFHKSASMSNLASREKEVNETIIRTVKSYKPSPSKTQSTLLVNKDTASDSQNHIRPISANHSSSSVRTGSTKLVGMAGRPMTCNANVVTNNNSRAKNNDQQYDPDAISKALQRLALDHRSRQLTASVSNLCDSDLNLDAPTIKRSTDPLTQTLLRQYQQSKKLLQESKAKHDAILSQSCNTNQTFRTILVHKPPSGVRSSQQSRLSCTTKK